MIRRLIDRLMRWLLPDVYRRLDLLEAHGITPLIGQTVDRLILVQSADWCDKRKLWIVGVRLIEKRANRSLTIQVKELSELSIRRALN